MANLDLDLSQSREQKILVFKSDPDKMKDLHDFLNELFEKACLEAESRQFTNKQKSRFELISIQNGTKRIGAWSNRARGFMSRVITAICNCTNSVRNAAANRT